MTPSPRSGAPHGDDAVAPGGMPAVDAAAGIAPLTVALVGNPNVGKSSLFTALAGIPTRVGNYPGVTVERKVGRFTHSGRVIDLIDLPGIYGLVPRSPDEQVAVDVLAGTVAGVAPIDCAVVVADATNLERNLYLGSQVLGLGIPVVVALTQSDVARAEGIAIDAPRLAERLGCPVIGVVAPAREGIDALAAAIVAAAAAPPPPAPRGLADIAAGIDGDHSPTAREAIARYAWIERQLAGSMTRSPLAGTPLARRIDALLTHRVWGTIIFAATMLAMFSSIFWLAAPLMDLLERAVAAIAAGARAVLPDGPIESLVADGLLAGVGSVAVFVPQIALLFAFVAILEGCGYMARAAFLMDRLLAGIGLSGRSFIPLLSSFACAIPGIMATRTIENRRDRLLTIMLAPLMSCSARLPVYLLFCGAFVPDRAVGVPWLRLPALVLVGLYALGVVVAALVAWTLSRTVIGRSRQPFVMELPRWRWPRWRVVGARVAEAAGSFLHNAGTLIVAVSVVIWALASYPHDERAIDAELAAERLALQRGLAAAPLDPALVAQRDRLDSPAGLAAFRRGAAQRHSALGRAGRFIEPLVRPLGWDWRIGCAVLASFPAREVVLGTLGVIYNLGDEDPDGAGGGLADRLRAARWDDDQRPVFTLPVALSIMVFFALCAQCASTLVVIGKETGGWIWPTVSFVTMTTLAWVAAWLTHALATAAVGA